MPQFQVSDIIIIILVIIGLIMVGLYFLNKRNLKQTIEAKEFIKQSKMTTTIFVIDKRYEKPTEKNLTKTLYEKLPKSAKFRKMAIIKAKVGPQVVTLTCDKSVYDILVPKKNVKVEIAGVYIVSVVGVNLEDKKDKTLKDKFRLFMAKGLK